MCKQLSIGDYLVYQDTDIFEVIDLKLKKDGSISRILTLINMCTVEISISDLTSGEFKLEGCPVNFTNFL